MKKSSIGLYVIIILIALFLSACEIPPHKYEYIQTSVGVISSMRGSCELGLLLSNAGGNINDADGKPITCTGYINLTRAEAKEWGK